MSIRILLADDHQIFREGLRSLLGAQPDMTVVGEADNGRDAVQSVEELSPDVVVMDLRMPDLNGVEATRQIVGRCPGAKVVALSAEADPRLTAETLRAGAAGFVVKEGAFEELATAIRTVMRDKVHLSPAVAGSVVEGYVRGDGGLAPSAFDSLSGREREVLQLMAEGKATKQIAAALHVSVKTIETHRRNIMEKLRIDNVAELTKYAVREGLTTL